MHMLTTAPLRSFHIHRFDIEWTERSYASRPEHGYDYTLIEESTRPLKTVPEYAPSRYDPNGL